MNPFGATPHNSEGAAVELNRLPHDLRIAAEAALPAVVTNDGNGMRIRHLIFFGQKCAPSIGFTPRISK